METLIPRKGTEKISWTKWDWPHDAQTEATSPATCCLARSFHDTDTVSKTQIEWQDEVALNNWQPVWNEQVLILNMSINFEHALAL